MYKKKMETVKIKRTTNQNQYRALVDFMKKYPDIAKGNSTKSSTELQGLWSNLQKQLNSMGPPSKDVTQWRKVWSDYKSFLRKKLSGQKKINMSSESGPNRKVFFSHLEEEVIELASLRDSMQAINQFQTIEFPTNEEDDSMIFVKNEPVENTYNKSYNIENDNNDIFVLPSLNDDVIQSEWEPRIYGTNRKYQYLLQKQVDCQKKFYETVSSALSKQNNSWQDNNPCKMIYASLRRIQGEHKVRNQILQEQLNEIIRHNKCVEELSEKKHKIKVKILELKLQKLKELKE
ncbi:uncharacterized protein LOC129609129 [Condylostylus longicornis]|uniref:uncharacterized protein LOC129609129 n=1 Tax=Condylostylus longicornis TaxID=2530218 RepID=UPI00244E2645|nr:uncharacterized protein LOC129609129 [Condylostylus longicornis]